MRSKRMVSPSAIDSEDLVGCAAVAVSLAAAAISINRDAVLRNLPPPRKAPRAPDMPRSDNVSNIRLGVGSTARVFFPGSPPIQVTFPDRPRGFRTRRGGGEVGCWCRRGCVFNRANAESSAGRLHGSFHVARSLAHAKLLSRVISPRLLIELGETRERAVRERKSENETPRAKAWSEIITPRASSFSERTSSSYCT